MALVGEQGSWSNTTDTQVFSPCLRYSPRLQIKTSQRVNIASTLIILEAEHLMATFDADQAGRAMMLYPSRVKLPLRSCASLISRPDAAVASKQRT
jgi:hypothetical protein